MAMMASHGAVVPGNAKVAGDSPQNDVVNAKLSPKEVVLPRSVTMAKDAPERAKKFMEEIMKQQGGAPGKATDYGDLLKVQREHKSRLDELEKKLKAKGS